MVSEYERRSLFLHVTRDEAEVSIVASLKYLVNHFFEMYGVEVHVGIKCSFWEAQAVYMYTYAIYCAPPLDWDGGWLSRFKSLGLTTSNFLLIALLYLYVLTDSDAHCMRQLNLALLIYSSQQVYASYHTCICQMLMHIKRLKAH